MSYSVLFDRRLKYLMASAGKFVGHRYGRYYIETIVDKAREALYCKFRCAEKTILSSSFSYPIICQRYYSVPVPPLLQAPATTRRRQVPELLHRSQHATPDE